ncbi:6-phosphogluconolactonase [Flavisphingomonas formosensis]|uniref:6-phosphogluconolactonase n=1 Tax=Flavisphingomonas formosensis TaxID=861534 RepID=UPI0012FB982C|nr:6-phosphogluconolactonase [Sphingomonas formosensis]
MIEAEWWDYEDEDELAEAVAGDVGFIIESALDARGQALIALPGGKTPGPVFAKLAKAKLDWKRVTIIPTDDRLVGVKDPLSNIAQIAKAFLPLGARVFPIVSEAAADYKAAGKAADARLSELHWPPDLVWLGIGADGHTASIFPGPDLDEALNGPKTRRALGVMPDPLPTEAPVARVTLSRAAIVAARTLTLVLTGKEKRKVLEQAIKQGASSSMPIGRVLAEAEQAIDIHWCP